LVLERRWIHMKACLQLWGPVTDTPTPEQPEEPLPVPVPKAALSHHHNQKSPFLVVYTTAILCT
jgi:hypothetical protein